jgi:hypothetical protein
MSPGRGEGPYVSVTPLPQGSVPCSDPTRRVPGAIGWHHCGAVPLQQETSDVQRWRYVRCFGPLDFGLLELEYERIASCRRASQP